VSIYDSVLSPIASAIDTPRLGATTMARRHVVTARYRAVATSLLPSDIEAADRISEILKDEGWLTASRSFVIREALARLTDDLVGKTSHEIFRDFIDRRGRRIGRRSSTNDAR
jgi:hypothetical protein